jgi:uncharacterized LabA/DUF88 family protein
MRSNSAIYVDAGYLLASAATRVTGTSLRNGIHVEFPKLVRALLEQTEQICGLPVLRMHWYDSARNGVPDVQQERIGELPKVKLRLGRFGVDGQQKGVDLRMGLDLVTHARNRAADVFVLVSGDDDLTEAVEEAQVHGVQVVILAVPNADGRPHGVSRHLIRAADALEVMTTEAVESSFIKVEVPLPTPVPTAPASTPTPRLASPTPNDLVSRPRPAPPAPTSILTYTAVTGGTSQQIPTKADPTVYDEQIDVVVSNVLESFRTSATPEGKAELQRGRPSIPRDIDRALLLDLSDALEVNDLSDPVRFHLRDRFWELFDEARL